MRASKTFVQMLAVLALLLPVLPAKGSDCNISILNSNPLSGIIDARQPHEPGSPLPRQGVKRIQLWMSSDASYAELSDFHIMVSQGTVPPVKSFTTEGNIVTIQFFTPIPVEAWTAVTHCSQTSVCIGYLPGDVDGSGASNAADYLQLIDCRNGAATCTMEQCDIDRDGVCYEENMDDENRLLDLLQGNGYNPAWNGRTIPSCNCAVLMDAPTVEAKGSRYLAITPADPDGLFDMKLVVSCAAGGPEMYSQVPSGSLNRAELTTNAGSAASLLPADWLNGYGAVYVTGTDLAPDTTYDVAVNYGASWNSAAATATTWPFGDVTDDGVCDFRDISCGVKCVEGNFGVPPCENTTEYACDIISSDPCLPEGVDDFRDLSEIVRAFQGGGYTCPDPCD